MSYAKRTHPASLEVLDAVELGRSADNITLSSGRRYELEAGERADQLTVRSANGRVLLRVAVTDDGPLLSFESAAITLSARSRLAICAPELELGGERVIVRATELEQCVAGDLYTVVEGNRHACILGEERVEAAAVALQANDESVRIKAMEHIALDGHHIGLNDDPCPAPFEWSAIGRSEP